jgi:hypothetical protein
MFGIWSVAAEPRFQSRTDVTGCGDGFSDGGLTAGSDWRKRSICAASSG